MSLDFLDFAAGFFVQQDEHVAATVKETVTDIIFAFNFEFLSFICNQVRLSYGIYKLRSHPRQRGERCALGNLEEP
ncbi:hypothetical protein LX32DRAFT_44588 [Colletotrichum zoysiae]|uniref:Uncharacterized protein n=1 Tax=Colletotrichum zoysiae TaxID=1216348 RepID=A0AAD9HBA4_9PEZI|nr:hypothetical protein LX32DRAFT_44588 [Colletotrichum zoysiae]